MTPPTKEEEVREVEVHHARSEKRKAKGRFHEMKKLNPAQEAQRGYYHLPNEEVYTPHDMSQEKKNAKCKKSWIS